MEYFHQSSVSVHSFIESMLDTGQARPSKDRKPSSLYRRGPASSSDANLWRSGQSSPRPGSCSLPAGGRCGHLGVQQHAGSGGASERPLLLIVDGRVVLVIGRFIELLEGRCSCGSTQDSEAETFLSVSVSSACVNEGLAFSGMGNPQAASSRGSTEERLWSGCTNSPLSGTLS